MPDMPIHLTCFMCQENGMMIDLISFEQYMYFEDKSVQDRSAKAIIVDRIDH